MFTAALFATICYAEPALSEFPIAIENNAFSTETRIDVCKHICERICIRQTRFGRGVTMPSDKESIETRCVHGDIDEAVKDGFRPISFPIFQSAAFSHVELGHNESGFDYTRETNPTRTRLEQIVASLESAADAIAFASGMAAISTVLELFGPGDHIVCSNDLYGGVFRLHNLINKKNGLEVDYVNTSDLSLVESTFRSQTKALYIETPTNPTMIMSDIAACARIAHEKGALLIVDNTFLTPYFQNPLDLGADIVVHSASKYLGGHNDTIGGFLCVKDEGIGEDLHMLAKTVGNSMAPFDAWLIMRGIKTLAVRMERQAANAQAVAEWLEKQSKVEHVLYPGLESFPQHDLAAEQARGFGAMISFYVDSEATALEILDRVRVITFAESLGGTESLMTYPLVQTHGDTPDALKEALGINDRLLRLSVGLEGADDLIGDLAQALG